MAVQRQKGVRHVFPGKSPGKSPWPSIYSPHWRSINGQGYRSPDEQKRKEGGCGGCGRAPQAPCEVKQPPAGGRPEGVPHAAHGLGSLTEPEPRNYRTTSNNKLTHELGPELLRTLPPVCAWPIESMLVRYKEAVGVSKASKPTRGSLPPASLTHTVTPLLQSGDYV